MEVFQKFRSIRVPFLLLFLLSFLGACAQKTSQSVFPEAAGNNAQTSSCGAQRIATEFIVQWEDGRISLEQDQNAARFIQSFVSPQLQQIRHVEFNKRIAIPPAPSEESELSSFASTLNWGQDATEASAAWNLGVKGQGIKVAVTDTPVDLEHSQLKGQFAENLAEKYGRPGVDDDGNGLVDDVIGWDFAHDRPQGLDGSSKVDTHGSHVSGIIAARHSQGPVQGIAPEAQIIPVTFLSDVERLGDLYGAIRSLNYAAQQGARVINASWGGPNCSESLRQTMENLSQQDILLVVAAGNEGKDLESSPDFPAAFEIPSQLTVAATRASGYLAGFSNTSYRYVHLAAPGDGIVSTVPYNRTESMSGTSMAAPFVSGAAALLRSFRPQAKASVIKQALLESVDTGNYRVMSRGRLNIRRALQRLEALVPASPQP